MASYEYLLKKCAQSDPTALKQLIDLEAPYLLSLASSLSSQQDLAESLVQTCFVLVWQHAASYDPALGSARAWIYSIFRFRAQQLQISSTKASPNQLSQLDALTNSLSADLQKIAQLDQAAFKLISRAYLQGLNYSELAKAEHTSIQHAQQLLDTALTQLQLAFPQWQLESQNSINVLGHYALGLLRNPEQALPAQQLLASQTGAAHDILVWEHIFSSLVYLLAESNCPISLSTRIFTELNLGLPVTQRPAPIVTESIVTPSPSLQAVLNAHEKIEAVSPTTIPESESEPEPEPKPQLAEKKFTPTKPAISVDEKDAASLEKSKPRLSPWHWACICSALLLVAALVWLLTPKAPTVQLVQLAPRVGAVLQAPGQNTTPGWIVSVDSMGHILFSPQVHTELNAGQMVQLWTQGPTDQHPISLGMIDPNQPVTVPAELIGALQEGQLFEMTLEKAGGASSPSSTVLFIGRLVRFGEYKEPTQS